MNTRTVGILALLLGLIAVALLWSAVYRGQDAGRAGAQSTDGPLTVAATGDSLMIDRLRAQDARALSAVGELIGSATVATTNLEVSLLARRPQRDSVRWPAGSAGVAAELKLIGFDAISLANNHAADYGAEGLRDTARILDRAGLAHAGAGEDLAAARTPVFIGTAPRRVAFLSVATSVAPDARATNQRGEIKGRPGVNAVRYAADVTVDPVTFETLKSINPGLGGETATGQELNLLGTPIKKGDRTVVKFTPDARDVGEVVEQISLARKRADAVIVALHSHEPRNHSQTPAEFVRQLARTFVDAGAHLVVGHGPHQLRGIETYNHGVILYSVGNFLFPYRAINPPAVDLYDAGIDLYSLALGALGEEEPRARPTFAEDVWWESVVAIATFENRAVTSVRLECLDLGTALPVDERGIPRIADPSRRRAILERLARLSTEFGTDIRVGTDYGEVALKADSRPIF